jgi:hypothetical protein
MMPGYQAPVDDRSALAAPILDFDQLSQAICMC